ncbi:MAG: hypothetical protein G01um101438_459 [Parcubacteria group bacterium Gr01-1014_38]|nr:MAG: hypothetical protein G01um101438_459 [Parcubacteria group bacterium Gr01-1014_38]
MNHGDHDWNAVHAERQRAAATFLLSVAIILLLLLLWTQRFQYAHQPEHSFTRIDTWTGRGCLIDPHFIPTTVTEGYALGSGLDEDDPRVNFRRAPCLYLKR